MRVTIYHPDGAVSAYKLGRIEEGIHNDHPLFGTVPLEELVQKTLDQAAEEYPDCEIKLERMVLDPNNPEQSIWVPDEEFDSNVHQSTPPGNQVEVGLDTSVRQEAG